MAIVDAPAAETAALPNVCGHLHVDLFFMYLLRPGLPQDDAVHISHDVCVHIVYELHPPSKYKGVDN